MSWRMEVHGCGDRAGVWTTNALRFATREEAQAHVSELGSRWFGFDDSQVVECTRPVTHTACTKVHNPELSEACTKDGCYYGKVVRLDAGHQSKPAKDNQPAS